MTKNDAPRIDKFLDFYNQLSGGKMQLLQQIYHPDVEFIDPVQQIQGLAALTAYFNHAYARLQHCSFTGQERMEQQQQGFLSWQMQFSHPAIGRGNMIEVTGCSVLRWQDNLIIYHRDYYDLDQMVFQHIPVLGWLTAKVKQQMNTTAR
jgi:hypothetical protein